ncbi:hypothetical protein [Oceanobacillus rekensis]|uniref:hypothetical protein n=1 Tax=Oceanobacillus rekensis TaxID=937927 RepID=UPI0011225D7F|nr:hypothetical protein [Oceanobacillus rekensis]
MITITDLADILARNYDVPFREAHKKASIIATKVSETGKELYDVPLALVNEWLEYVQLEEKDWEAIVDPKHFVESRSVTGGTNPDVVREMIKRRKLKLV